MFMNVMTTNVGEATELLANLTNAIITVCILYIPPIALGIYLVHKKRYTTRKIRLISRNTALYICIFGIALVVICCIFVKNFNARRELFPYNVCENLITAIIRTSEAQNYATSSAEFSYKPTSTRPDSIREVYVMVIGETARAANWQLLGYKRPTNPRLSAEPNIVAFDKALSEINTTHKSVPMLMSWLTAETFGDNVASTKSIFSAFNDLGYYTAFISNHHRNHSYIDFYGEEADTVHFISDAEGPQLDENLLVPFVDFIAKSTANKLFIILHTYGSHFEYNKHYSPKMSYFKPDTNSKASIENRQQLINAYDNSIRYTDMILSSIIEQLRTSGRVAAMIYASDHGEDIYDDARERFLHASPVATYHQLHVPLIVWTSDSFNKLYPEKYQALVANKHKDVSSSASLFHTTLDLAGINSPYFKSQLSLSSKDYNVPRRRYLNDYNESVSLHEAGLREYDFKQMNKLNISIN